MGRPERANACIGSSRPHFWAKKAHGGGFPAGDDEAVQALQVFRQPYLYRLNAQAGQDMFVLNESTLQSQDTNFHHSSLRPRNPGQTEQVDH
jgi:hypothetical protein